MCASKANSADRPPVASGSVSSACSAGIWKRYAVTAATVSPGYGARLLRGHVEQAEEALGGGLAALDRKLARTGVGPGAYRMRAMHVDLWTDGACSGNPGPGGWAAILVARRVD